MGLKGSRSQTRRVRGRYARHPGGSSARHAPSQAPSRGGGAENNNATETLTDQSSKLKPVRTGMAILAGIIYICFVAAMVLGAVTNTNPAEPCPDDWIYYRKSCYYFEENEADWHHSKWSCSENKSSLITLTNSQEMKFILKLICKQSYWVGLHKNGEEHVWTDGQSLNDSGFTVLGDGECGYIQPTTDRNTRSISLSTCSLPRKSICKMAPYRLPRP